MRIFTLKCKLRKAVLKWCRRHIRRAFENFAGPVNRRSFVGSHAFLLIMRKLCAQDVPAAHWPDLTTTTFFCRLFNAAEAPVPAGVEHAELINEAYAFMGWPPVGELLAGGTKVRVLPARSSL